MNKIKGDDKDDTRTVMDIFSAYTELLERYQYCVVDIYLLPISKADMKKLIKAVYLKSNKDSEKHFYETAYILLSTFQDGVGMECIDGKLLMDMDKKSSKLNDKTSDEWMLWINLATAEMEILRAEWKRFRKVGIYRRGQLRGLQIRAHTHDAAHQSTLMGAHVVERHGGSGEWVKHGLEDKRLRFGAARLHSPWSRLQARKGKGRAPIILHWRNESGRRGKLKANSRAS